MKFNEYLRNAWATHAENPRFLADDFKSQFTLMESVEDVMAMSKLIVHVCGEHLGDWEKGIELLRKIKNNATISDKSEMNRYVAILNLGNNPKSSIDHMSLSDQAHVYAMTASALTSLGGLKNAERFFKSAVEIAKTTLLKNDPAHKAIAMAGNNIACRLDEKIELTSHESELMIFAAKEARLSWELAGTWKEVERAEYRLSKSFFKNRDFKTALIHAEACMEIIRSNKEEPVEIFFASEVLALSHYQLKNQMGFASAIAQMKGAFDELESSDQNWCQKTLDTIEELNTSIGSTH